MRARLSKCGAAFTMAQESNTIYRRKFLQGVKYVEDLLDLHTHTIMSGHAYSTLKEMAEAAARKGLKLLGVSEHAPAMPGSCHEMYFRNFKAIGRRYYGVELLLGAELNIMSAKGAVDLPERTLRRMDYAIASLHDQCLPAASRAENTAALIGAMEHPYVNVIGHPDNGKYPVDYEAVVDAAARCAVILEVNNSSLYPNSHRPNARENSAVMLQLCAQRGVPVVVSSDAHFEAQVGDHDLAYEMLRQLDFPEALVLNRSVEELKAALARKTAKRK